MPQTYTTKKIADIIGIHANTVRFYEQIGFLTKPERLPNGYRVFTDLHIRECRLIRLAMRAEVMQNGLRNKAVEIVRLCAELDFDGAMAAAGEYRSMLEKEIQNAEAAIIAVEDILAGSLKKESVSLKRKDAARALDVTSETLRNWERSGLIKTKRSENGYRIYSAEDMERLNIIRTLRLAGYSLSAILRLINRLGMQNANSVEAILKEQLNKSFRCFSAIPSATDFRALPQSTKRKFRIIQRILNTPEDNEDIVSVCDRLVLSLESTAKDAERIMKMIEQIREKFYTLQ